MTTLRHPHIYPVLEIEIPDDRVESHLRAGWLLPEAEPEIPSTDPEPTGEDHEKSEETTI